MSDRRTVHLDLHQRTYDRLLALKQSTGAATLVEVVRAALRAYEIQLLPHEKPDIGQLSAKTFPSGIQNPAPHHYDAHDPVSAGPVES